MIIELKELTEKTIELFGINNPSELGPSLMGACNDQKQLQGFYDLVEGDLSKDWLQMIYQYYLADRKDKKQDYTPASLARFMGMLAGESERVIDMCAGSGSLIIQKWNLNHEVSFVAIENDENVIPFLLFNMVLRNIRCDVLMIDALSDEPASKAWSIKKGERFGCITNFKSAV
jgi:type I restriction enzyme M protein